MIIDGRALAADICTELQNRISHLPGTPHLTIFTCAPDQPTQTFLKLKKQKAEQIGVAVNVIEFPTDITAAEVKLSIEYALMQTDGILVQLPFPESVVIDEVLRSVPGSYDVDCVHYDGTSELTLPPVVGAIKAMGERHDVMWAAQSVVVVGNGRLVGAPAAVWAMKQGAQVTVIDEHTDQAEKATALAAADILILGVGQPGLIQPEQIKEGVIIFDAGTSETGGVLVGDAASDCREKAALFTPVPGGIGPVTVAMVYHNLVALVETAAENKT